MKNKILAIRKKTRQGDLVTLSQRIIEKLEDNPNFPNLPPALFELKKVIPEYRTSLVNAQGREKIMVAIKNNKKEIVLNLLEELSGYVTAICKGDKTLLLSSGFDVTTEGNATLAPAIEKLEVELGPPGEATTRLKNITGAIAFIHEYATEPPGPNTIWIYKGTSLSTYTFTELTSDKRYWFRVMAIGRGGQTSYSPIVTRVIQ